MGTGRHEPWGSERLTGRLHVMYPTSLALLHHSDLRLRGKANPVEQFDNQLAAFCDQMVDLMGRSGGIGLAAPQVGVNARVFVTTGVGQSVGIPSPNVWINPVIIHRFGAQQTYEGCLSFPGYYGLVSRAQQIMVIWQDLLGRRHTLSVGVQPGSQDQSLLSRCIQHEVDHLDGILMVDHDRSDGVEFFKTFHTPVATLKRQRYDPLESVLIDLELG